MDDSGKRVSGGLIYEPCGDNAVFVTGYTGKPEALVIPDALDGKPVLGIERGAFCSCASLTEVTVPDSVRFIGEAAFCGCASLHSLRLPPTLDEIEDRAFEACVSLREAGLPWSVKRLGAAIFRGCTSLQRAVFCCSHGLVPNDMFMGCSSLTEVYIDSTVDNIGFGAFESCASLRVVHFLKEREINTIPNGFRFIHGQAFKGCRSLTELKMPKGEALIIWDNAFDDCPALTLVVEPNSSARYYAITHYISYRLPTLSEILRVHR